MRGTVTIRRQFIVFFALTFVGGLVFLGLLYQALGSVGSELAGQVAAEKQAQLDVAVQIAGEGALSQAAQYARDPRVVGALELAHTGDLSDEADPVQQLAREQLRSTLAGTLAGYAAVRGAPLRLHVHVPPARSLLRAWRPKQAKRDGQWVDVSDDLASFRNMVLDVNQAHTPLYGIELGRGGFVVRGISPVSTDAGRHLGSVEILVDFDPLFTRLWEDGQEGSLRLYMPKEHLQTTTRLRDPDAYPVLADAWVQVADEGTGALAERFTPEALAAGLIAPEVQSGAWGNAVTFPVRDYRGEPVGVIAYAWPLTVTQELVRSLVWRGALGLGLILAFLVTGGLYVVQRGVVNPAGRIEGLALQLADGTLDPRHAELEVRGRDELARVARAFNMVLEKVRVSSLEAERMAGHLQALEMPVLEVDADHTLHFINRAGAALAGVQSAEAIGQKCHDVFDTSVCRRDCPIDKVFHSGKTERSDARAGLGRDADLPVQVTGVPLRDASGRVHRALDVIVDLSDVYDVVDKVRAESGQLTQASVTLDASAGELDTQGRSMRDEALLGREQVDALARDLETASDGAGSISSAMHGLSAAVEEMSASMVEVSRLAAGSSEVAGRVRERAERARELMADLERAASHIGKVADVIAGVAGQTNLLALNATIEAASAGEAGSGFAVVASEVKQLALRTKASTVEIRDKIDQVIEATGATSTSLAEVVDAISDLSELAIGSATAVEEQASTVSEIAHQIARSSDEATGVSERVQEASERARSVAGSVDRVAESVESVAVAIEETREQSESLTAMSGRLSTLVDQFQA